MPPALLPFLEVSQEGLYEQSLMHTESKNIFGMEGCLRECIHIRLGQN